jgi:hypothetical protein
LLVALVIIAAIVIKIAKDPLPKRKLAGFTRW